MNRVQLKGFVGGDPEIRTLTGGGKVVSFSMATEESWKADGEWKSRSTWHRVESFRESDVEMIGNHVKKGSLVQVEGMIRIDTFEKDGVSQQRVKILMAAKGHSIIVVPHEKKIAA